MAIAKEFTDWQKRPKSDLTKFRTASPALVSLRNYLLANYGGASLGIYGVRTVRGGSQTSSHAYGAAMDWSYRGETRAVADSVIDFVISNSNELGIQAVHDYQNSKIWRANRSSDKNGGWKNQRKASTGMGQSWADWIHIEVNERQWGDGRTVEEKIKTEFRPTLRRGDKGDYVRLVQTTLRDKAGQKITVDGNFGTQTEMAVRNVQSYVTNGKGIITGIVDSEFWKIIDLLNKG